MKALPVWLKLNLAGGFFLGILGNCFLVLGLRGSFNSFALNAAACIMLVGFIAFATVILQNQRQAKKTPKTRLKGDHWTRLEFACLLILAAVFVGLTLLQGLLPPIDRDALIHHLAIPALYLKHHRIIDLPFAEQAYNPMLVDLLFALPIAWARDSWSSLLHYAFGLLSAQLVFGICRKFYSRNIAWLGAVIFLSLPQVMQSGSQAYVDLGVTYYSFLSMVLLIFWFEQVDDKKILFLSGVSCGFAMASKYNGFLTFVLLELILAMAIIQNREWRQRGLLYLALFVAGAFIADLPWMIRNALWTGNPIYPFLRSTLGWKRPEADIMAEIPALLHRYFLYHESIWEMLALPARIFFFGQEDKPELFDGRLSPVLLFFIPIFFRKKKPMKLMEKNLLFFSFLYLMITLIFRILRMRYLLPIVPMFTVLAIMGWQSLRPVSLKSAGKIIIYGLIGINLFWGARRFRERQVLPYLTHRMTRDEYLHAHLAEYPVFQWAHAHLSQNSKILFVFLGDRGYYCAIPYTYDFHNPGRSWRKWLQSSATSAELKENIQREGITHLLIRADFYWDALDVLTGSSEVPEGKVRLLKDFFAMHTRLLFKTNQVELSELI